MNKQKLVRITTVPLSLDKLLSGQLRYMNSFYEVIAVSAEGVFGTGWEKRRGSNVSFGNVRKITPIADLTAVIRLYLFLRKEKPSIVHTHTPKAGIVGMLASKLAGIPYRFHTVAGMPLLEAGGVKRVMLDFVERLTYKCATKVYPNSFGLKEIIVSNDYCSETKLKVLAKGSSNGIDTSYFSPDWYTEQDNESLRKQLGIDANDFVFVFVGRLVADKGINEMVAAFELLQKEHSRGKLLLVGDYETDLDPLLPKTMDSIKTDKNIISVGFQPDVRPYLAVSNALVFPSYREGFPNVVMQAGALGLPSIVSDINGCNEIVVEGVNGTIIPVKDSGAIFETMKRLIEDRDYYSQLRSNARNSITSRYDQQVVWDAILEEYSKP